MQVDVTKRRLALAGVILVLSGAGLATVLSPLVGSALATAGQIVNITDPTDPYAARVDSSGALKVTGGPAVPVLPATPWTGEATLMLSASNPTSRRFLGRSVGSQRLAVTALTVTTTTALNSGQVYLVFDFWRTAAGTTSCPNTGPPGDATSAGARLLTVGAPYHTAELTFPTAPWIARTTSASDQAMCLYAYARLTGSLSSANVYVQGTGFYQ
jgi:hypothetical protein